MKKIILADWLHDGSTERKGSFFIVVSGGRIEDSGQLEKEGDEEGLLGQNAELLDFRGKLLTPGLVDSHNHFTLTALKMLFQIDLGNAVNFNGIRDALQRQAENGRDWVLGYNLNEFVLDEKRLPTANELDEMVPGFPVLVTHSSEHSAICNSRALELSGIDRSTKDPHGAAIGRYVSGEPNGILYESAAMDLAKSRVPEHTLDEYMEAIRLASLEYRKHGLTAVKDIGGTGNDVNEWRRIEALNRLSENGGLHIRVGVSVPVYSLEEVGEKIELAKSIRNNDLVRFTGFKMFLDGSGLTRTGWMKEEWNIDYYGTDRGNFGMPLWNMDNFRKAVTSLAAVGKPISIHTIGDRAISTGIGIIKDLRENHGAVNGFAFVHANLPAREDISALKQLAISIETQAPDIYFLGWAYLGNVGRERAGRLFPFKTLLDAGVNVCNGSDSPVMRFEPAYGVVASMNRQMRRKPAFPGKYLESERLTLEETIRTYTGNGSVTMEWPDIGFLRKGSFADLVVWKEIPETLDMGIDPERIFDRVLFNGKNS